MTKNSYNEETICALPFSHLSTTPNGSIMPCCRYENDTLGNITQQSLEEVWNSEKLQNLRRELYNGIKHKNCAACWRIEEANGISMRQSMLKTRREYIPKISNDDFVLPFKIPVLELKLSNLCNLKCRTCNPKYSSSWISDWHHVRHIYQKTYCDMGSKKLSLFEKPEFYNSFEKLLPFIEILEFAGGEPFMDPQHYKLLDMIVDCGHNKNITLKYSTNLTHLQFGKWNLIDVFLKFKKIDLSVSLDGDPMLNEYIRSGSTTDAIQKNLLELKKQLGNNLDHRICLCFSALNFFALEESYEYFHNCMKSVVHGNILFNPPFLNVRVIPFETRQFIYNKYQNFLNRLDHWSNIQLEPKNRIIRFVKTNSNYMMMDREDAYHKKYWESFKDYIKILDQHRMSSYESILQHYKVPLAL